MTERPHMRAESTHLDGFRKIRGYVLVVTTGRSGSSFMTNLVNQNALNAFSEHEAHVEAGDVTTRWWYDGDEKAIRQLVERKLARLRRGEHLAALPLGRQLHPLLRKTRLGGRFPRVPVREIYVEVDNGALKSWGPAMVEAIPETRIVHLTRDPLLQAKSAENRRTEPNADRPYFLWPAWERNLLRLSDTTVSGLSRFQLALWYWLEMEVRYTTLLCAGRQNIELDLAELSDPARVLTLFEALGIRHCEPIALGGGRNEGPRESVIGERDREEARALLRLLPPDTLSRVANAYDLTLL